MKKLRFRPLAQDHAAKLWWRQDLNQGLKDHIVGTLLRLPLC